MSNFTVANAKNTPIFVVETTNKTYAKETITLNNGRVIELNRLQDYDLKVVETNLFDFVMQSAEETTSPVGVMPKLHIRHEDFQCRYGRLNAVNNNDGLYEVWNWGPSGNGSHFIDVFETKAEAEDFIFNRTYDYDFNNDDQRNTQFFFTREEAMHDIVDMMAGHWNVNHEVAASILQKKEKLEKLREAKTARQLAAQAEAAKADKERIHRIALEYAAMTDKVPNETYKQTAARLSAMVDGRIEKAVFNEAVKIIRSRSKF